LEQRIHRAERQAEFWKQEGILAQAQQMQDEYSMIQGKQKVEKVKEKISEVCTTIRKTTPQLPESIATSEIAEQIELLQVVWSELEKE